MVGNVIKSALSLLPQPVLGSIERFIQDAQGKGWGAATLSREVYAIKELIGDSFEPSVAFDVGANIGEWAAEFHRIFPKTKIYCFEPSSKATELLAARFSKNQSIVLEKTALSNESGQENLWFDSPGSGLASLVKRDLTQFGIDYSSSECVEVTTLDSYCSQNLVVPDVIKLDIEGNEMKALQGGDSILETVQVIQFEFGGTNIDSRTYFRDFFQFLTSRGFKIYRLGPRGLTLITIAREEDEIFRVTNYFALR
jgi:FkbM family methyltransferase